MPECHSQRLSSRSGRHLRLWAEPAASVPVPVHWPVPPSQVAQAQKMSSPRAYSVPCVTVRAPSPSYEHLTGAQANLAASSCISSTTPPFPVAGSTSRELSPIHAQVRLDSFFQSCSQQSLQAYAVTPLQGSCSASAAPMASPRVLCTMSATTRGTPRTARSSSVPQLSSMTPPGQSNIVSGGCSGALRPATECMENSGGHHYPAASSLSHLTQPQVLVPLSVCMVKSADSSSVVAPSQGQVDVATLSGPPRGSRVLSCLVQGSSAAQPMSFQRLPIQFAHAEGPHIAASRSATPFHMHVANGPVLRPPSIVCRSTSRGRGMTTGCPRGGILLPKWTLHGPI